MKFSAGLVVPQRLQSMFWHAGPRIFRVLSGAIGSVVVARHLGPEDFGELCFATVVVSLAAVLVQFGSLEVITKNAALHPGQARLLLRKAFFLRGIGALVAGGIVLVIPFWLGHPSLYQILALLPLTLVPDCVEAVFFGRSEFREVAPIRAISSFLGLAVRLWLASHGGSVEAFATATVAEGAIHAFLFLLFRQRLPFSAPAAGLPGLDLFQQSLPLVGSGLVVALMLKLDQFLLQGLRPGPDVGYYYVVVRLFEMAGILIPSFVAAILPEMTRLKSVSLHAYQMKMILIYRRTYQGGLLAGFFAGTLAPWTIPAIFGQEYFPAVPVFIAYAFVFPSFVIGSIRGMDFVIMNKNQNHLLVAMALFPLQTGLCTIGILLHGPAGLAVAMALVAFVSTTLFSLILPPLRGSGVLQKEALAGLFRR